MDKISINLLPSEVLIIESDRRKRALFIKLAILILVVMVGLTGSVLLTRLIQNQQLTLAKKQLDASKAKVQAYSNQETVVFYLGERLKDISGLIGQDSKYVQSYNLLNKLTPPNMTISSVTFDKSGNITLSTQADNTLDVKTFLDGLIDPKVNEGKVSKVRIDDLNRSQDGKYRVDLTITIT